MWFVPGIYWRWPVGARVRVVPLELVAAVPEQAPAAGDVLGLDDVDGLAMAQEIWQTSGTCSIWLTTFTGKPSRRKTTMLWPAPMASAVPAATACSGRTDASTQVCGVATLGDLYAKRVRRL